MSKQKQPDSGIGQDVIAPASPPPSPAGDVCKIRKVKEIGGVQGPEPTRYGDWEKNGRCIDF